MRMLLGLTSRCTRPALVGVGQRITDLGDDLSHLIQRHGLAMHQVGQRAALDEGHGDVGVAFRLAEVVDRQNVNMLQLGDQLGFLLEAAGELGVAGEVARQDLECHLPVDAGLVGLIHRGHTTLAQRREHLVLAKPHAG